MSTPPRALAIIPVIFYHAGFSTVSGGFVGVDIFFVISGYLISSIVIRDSDEDRFSLLKFYERRARRILPALGFIMLCCLPFAWALMTPLQYRDFSNSIMAMSLFSSNILFWRETDYFGAAAELKPLLHTWSLSVEEQFYILFPILIIFTLRYKRKFFIHVVVALSLASLAIAEWATTHAPSAGFFLLPARAWELGAGAICAFLLIGRTPFKSSLLSGVGLGLILYSIFFFDTATPFPSLWTLFPVAGTALIILFADRSTIIARLFSIRPIVGIGLISYSAYLWHQPIFAFFRLWAVAKPSAFTMLALSGLALGLAFLSWRFVERPFRTTGKGKAPAFSQRAIFALSGGLTAFFLGFSLIGIVTKGAPFRAAPSGVAWHALAIDARLAANSGLSSQCTGGVSFDSVIANPRCRTGDNPEVVLWGDSFAMHLAQALKASELNRRHKFLQLTLSRCSPILDFGGNPQLINSDECILFNDLVFNYIKKRHDIKIVIMSSPYDILDASQRYFGGTDNFRADYAFRQMLSTAHALRDLGKIPVFVTPPPANGSDLGQCLAAALGRGMSGEICNFGESDIERTRSSVFGYMDRLQGLYPVIDLRRILCKQGHCLVGDKGIFLFRDSGHLSAEGSSYIGSQWDPFSGLNEDSHWAELSSANASSAARDEFSPPPIIRAAGAGPSMRTDPALRHPSSAQRVPAVRLPLPGMTESP